jgi:poly(3-hydroxybutyrate) depolymerase
VTHDARVIALAALVIGCSREVRSNAAPDAEPADSMSGSGSDTSATSEAMVDSPHASATSGCAPSGAPPSSYRRPSLSNPISLREGWRLTVGDPKGASAQKHDDSAWTTLFVPGVFLLTGEASRQKSTTVWLRRKFTLAEARTLSFDLGGRAGETTVFLDGTLLDRGDNGAPIFHEAPPLAAGEHALAMKLVFGKWVGGVRWWGEAAMGELGTSPATRGLLLRSFTSALDGSAQNVTVRVPRCADLARPMPLVVALPGWNGNEWSFAHSRLLEEADRRGWLVLTPNPRGNRLYTGPSEDGVLEAIDLVSKELAVDADRVFLTGVSMGGAGALQLAYHHPDRFAAVVAFYGDSKYEMSTYVSKILGTKENAARYSVLEFPENARNFPVLLVHAKDDDVSGFDQSRWLAEADEKLGFSHHRLIAPATGGHTQQLFEDHVDDLVALFSSSKREPKPPRVTFKTSSSHYHQAHWIDLRVRTEGTFGLADVSFDTTTRTLRLLRVDANVAELAVDLAALGVTEGSLALQVDASITTPMVFELRGAKASGVPQKLAKGTYALTIAKRD